MTRDQWFAARKDIGMAMMDAGISEEVAHRTSLAVMTETYGDPPVRRQWEDESLTAAVELGTEGDTVDVKVEDEWVSLAPGDARAMAVALVTVAVQAETVVKPVEGVTS